ncbi:MAG: LysR family transcriptional regulator [Burkholderiaceae bacterium]
MGPTRMHHPSTRRYFRHGMLPQLLVFEAIARLGSLTRAAEEVCLAQPTVSAQLKKLTDTVGAPLVEQVGKKLYLTEVGKALHRSCEELIDLLQRTEDRLAQAHSPEQGLLRLATTPTGHGYLHAPLAAFCRRFPRVKVRLEVANRQQMLARLLAHQDDLAVLCDPGPALAADALCLGRDGYRVYAPAGHRWAGGPVRSLAEVMAEPMICREPGSDSRRVIEQSLASHPQADACSPNVRMEVMSNEAVLQALSDELGLAVLADRVAEPARTAGFIVPLAVDGFPVVRSWYLCQPEGRAPTPTAQWFKDFVRQHGAPDGVPAAAPPALPADGAFDTVAIAGPAVACAGPLDEPGSSASG